MARILNRSKMRASFRLDCKMESREGGIDWSSAPTTSMRALPAGEEILLKPFFSPLIPFFLLYHPSPPSLLPALPFSPTSPSSSSYPLRPPISFGPRHQWVARVAGAAQICLQTSGLSPPSHPLVPTYRGVMTAADPGPAPARLQSGVVAADSPHPRLATLNSSSCPFIFR